MYEKTSPQADLTLNLIVYIFKTLIIAGLKQIISSMAENIS